MSVDVLEKIIYPVIDELNETQQADSVLNKSRETPLLGTQSPLDSLGLVNLIVAVEGQIEDELGVSLTLANEKALSRQNSPFKTVGTLSEYINELLDNEQQSQ